MIVQTQRVTGKIQEEQTESRDDISDNELADPSCIQATTKTKRLQKVTTSKPKTSLLKVIMRKLNILYFVLVYNLYFVTV